MPANTKVVFTAHSLPRRILDAGDPYPGRAAGDRRGGRRHRRPRAVGAVVGRLAVGGRDPGAVARPDILEVIDELRPSENADGLLVCPCGFVADHLEVLYDLDIEARQRAEEQGLAFDRTASMNADDPAVIAGRSPSDRVALSRDVGEAGRRRRGRHQRARHRLRALAGRRCRRSPSRSRCGGHGSPRRQAAPRRSPACRRSTRAPTPSSPGPHGADLAHRVGLGEPDVADGRLRGGVVRRAAPDPRGLLLGVPTGALRLAAAGLLSWRGKARAAVEPLLPAATADDSIGALVRSRFGDEVHERLVDALVGSIYAADTDRFSLAMVPQLAALAAEAAACC